MTVQRPLVPVNIHDLMQKLTELKGTFPSRRFDVEQLLDIKRLLNSIHEVLTQFSKESNELLRLLRCCVNLLFEGIRGKSCFTIVDILE